MDVYAPVDRQVQQSPMTDPLRSLRSPTAADVAIATIATAPCPSEHITSASPTPTHIAEPVTSPTPSPERYTSPVGVDLVR
jgi:hypothetical protein